ncbi:hypothetical protein GXN78_31325 (plasmid) [Variovorax sp. WS11]|nr:hypothetical protein [Variovorax sp. WS11]
MTDLIGGEIPSACAAVGDFLPYVQAGRCRAFVTAASSCVSLQVATLTMAATEFPTMAAEPDDATRLGERPSACCACQGTTRYDHP